MRVAMLPDGASVTFDTNTVDKAARPERHPKDPAQADFQKVHDALKAGILRGLFCETVATLEGIQRVDRARVFGSTYLATRHSEPEVQADGGIVHRVNVEATQPGRRPLHEENARRLAVALRLGFRALPVPRIAMPRIDDPDKRIYIYEDENAVSPRLDRFFEAARAIEARGFGMVPITKIAARLANRAGVTEPWYSSLDRADSAEEKEISNAIAEWADGDTVAAHISFQVDYLCTGDRPRARSSIFDPTERAWLAATYGVRFVTISELAALLPLV
jgi:hypothetical protein